jgi:hypothetical protein
MGKRGPDCYLPTFNVRIVGTDLGIGCSAKRPSCGSATNMRGSPSSNHNWLPLAPAGEPPRNPLLWQYRSSQIGPPDLRAHEATFQPPTSSASPSTKFRGSAETERLTLAFSGSGQNGPVNNFCGFTVPMSSEYKCTPSDAVGSTYSLGKCNRARRSASGRPYRSRASTLCGARSASLLRLARSGTTAVMSSAGNRRRHYPVTRIVLGRTPEYRDLFSMPTMLAAP